MLNIICRPKVHRRYKGSELWGGVFLVHICNGVEQDRREYIDV